MLFDAAATGPVLDFQGIRPPAVPLVLHDPYFSIWSPSERLADADTKHWTGGPDHLFSWVKVDGSEYRLIGKTRGPRAAMNQTGLEVLPTRTRVTYEQSGVRLIITFATPVIPKDLDLMSGPITYVDWTFQSIDGKKHTCQMNFAGSGHIPTNRDDAMINFKHESLGQMSAISAADSQPRMLLDRGDGTQINWGTFFIGAPKTSIISADFGHARQKASESMATLKFTPQVVGAQPQTGWLLLAYDEEFAIQYFGQNLRPYWRRNGATARKLIANAPKSQANVIAQCEKFDQELLADLLRVGGKRYAALASLAYRQCAAGCKLASDSNGQPLWFPKENTSNGCIATVDVIYPMSPQALLFGPSLTKALLQPVLAYSASSRWKFPFAPHDVGTYPQANGQVYGGGERTEENQMPVEESANMLIMLAALAKMEGNADYSLTFWPQLSKWANYLIDKGLDPENQLCTDDFLGHLAHNVNLSAKAILGIQSYSDLAKRLGKKTEADRAANIAKQYASEWVKRATATDHTTLTFGNPDSWSQKYNLVWDRILNFGLFPPGVSRREMAYYRKKLNPFGLPLDSRGPGAKLDWSIWTATLTQNPEDFEALIEGVYRYVNESPQRVGMGDWYDTAQGNFNFMHSRPVVGGVLLPLLYDNPKAASSTWIKWASRDRANARGWSTIPKPPIVTEVVPTAQTAATTWKYTFSNPGDGWNLQDFKDTSWKSGQGGFGREGTPGAVNRTPWETSDIWLRRSFELKGPVPSGLKLYVHHDEDVEIYLNGVLAMKASGYSTQYNVFTIEPAALKALRKGNNTMALHCRQTNGGQYVDAGLILVKPAR